MQIDIGDRSTIVLALVLALGTTAGVSAFVTYYWFAGSHSSRIVAVDLPEYDYPDHSGQMVEDTSGEKQALDRLGSDYEVDIRGDLATVTVEQSFKNNKDRRIDSVYEFPLNSNAAVYEMVIEIGDRRIESEVQRKHQARQAYKRAKRRGEKAALLEQDRPNLFTQRVANVEPGQRVDVTLKYTHPLPKADGAYRMVVPLAVPDRYVPKSMEGNRLVDHAGGQDPGASPGGTSESKNESEKKSSNVSLTVRIDGGMPVSKVASLSHKVDVEERSPNVRQIELIEKLGATSRHFRLAYQLSGDEANIGAHSHWDADTETGYFDLLIEPPASVSDAYIPPREMVFVVDRSGSMGDRRLKAAKNFVTHALRELRPHDRFRLIMFSDNVSEFTDQPLPATNENVERAITAMKTAPSTGGTEMVPAVERALKPTPPKEIRRMAVFVTDMKVANEFDVLETVREHVGEARVFSLGVGGDVNRYLLEAISRAGRGFYEQFNIDRFAEDASSDDKLEARRQELITDFVHRLQSPVLTDISIDWGEMAAEQVTPTPIPDVHRGGSVRVHGTYDQPGEYTVTVSGTMEGGDVQFNKTLDFSKEDDDGKVVRLGWARDQIQGLMALMNTPRELRPDQRPDAELRDEITQLGLEHSLATEWTSFVAVSEGREDSLDSLHWKRLENKKVKVPEDVARGKIELKQAEPGAESATTGGGDDRLERGGRVKRGASRGGGGHSGIAMFESDKGSGGEKQKSPGKAEKRSETEESTASQERAAGDYSVSVKKVSIAEGSAERAGVREAVEARLKGVEKCISKTDLTGSVTSRMEVVIGKDGEVDGVTSQHPAGLGTEAGRCIDSHWKDLTVDLDLDGSFTVEFQLRIAPGQ